MSLVTVNLTATFHDTYGLPVTTTRPTIRLSTPVSNGTAPDIVPTTISCRLNALGQLVGYDGSTSIPLVALDVDSADAPVQPLGAFFVIEGMPGQVRPFPFVLTADMAPTVDLAALPRAVPSNALYSPLSVAQVNALIAAAIDQLTFDS